MSEFSNMSTYETWPQATKRRAKIERSFVRVVREVLELLRRSCRLFVSFRCKGVRRGITELCCVGTLRALCVQNWTHAHSGHGRVSCESRSFWTVAGLLEL